MPQTHKLGWRRRVGFCTYRSGGPRGDARTVGGVPASRLLGEQRTRDGHRPAPGVMVTKATCVVLVKVVCRSAMGSWFVARASSGFLGHVT